MQTTMPEVTVQKQPSFKRNKAVKDNLFQANFQNALQDRLNQTSKRNGYASKKDKADAKTLQNLLNGTTKMNIQESSDTNQLSKRKLTDLLKKIMNGLNALQDEKASSLANQLQQMIDQLEDGHDSMLDLLDNLGLTDDDIEELMDSLTGSLGDYQDDEQTIASLSKLQHFIAKLLDETDDEQTVDDIEGRQAFALAEALIKLDSDQTNNEALKQISKQAKQLISQISSQDDAKKVTGELGKLLEKWTELTKGKQQINQTGDATNTTGKQTNKVNAIWQKLLQYAQNQQSGSDKKQTTGNQKLSTDKINDILSGLVKDMSTDKNNRSTGASLSSMPMTKVEQYVIHLNQQSETNQPGQQLIDQVQKAMKTSQFLKNNGHTQLQLTLKPDNLGDVLVKLTNVDGEMAVKMIASSQAAKDMLESNLHQLKHLFSPNHVIIEKQDSTVQPGQKLDGHQEDDQMQQGEGHGQQDQDGDDQQSNQNSNEDQTSFSEWLEKV